MRFEAGLVAENNLEMQLKRGPFEEEDSSLPEQLANAHSVTVKRTSQEALSTERGFCGFGVAKSAAIKNIQRALTAENCL